MSICPTHGIPDCSPLLNGCTYYLSERDALLAEVEQLREWKANAEITLREDRRVMNRDAALLAVRLPRDVAEMAKVAVAHARDERRDALTEAADAIEERRSTLGIGARALDMGRAWSAEFLRARAAEATR